MLAAASPTCRSPPETCSLAAGPVVPTPTLPAAETLRALTPFALMFSGLRLALVVTRSKRYPVPVLPAVSCSVKRLPALLSFQVNVVRSLPIGKLRLAVGAVNEDQAVAAEPAQLPHEGTAPLEERRQRVPAPPCSVTRSLPVESV